MKSWFYYMDGGKAVGPLEKGDILGRIQERRIGPYQLMLRDGETEWRPALLFSEFREQLASLPTDAKLSRPWIVMRKPERNIQPESLGPFSSDEIWEHLKSGHIQYVDYVWKDGMHRWRRIGQLKEFSLEKKPMITPPPLAEPKLEPPPNISKPEVLRNVEVVEKKSILEPDKEKIPEDADGDDLTLTKTALAESTLVVETLSVKTNVTESPPPIVTKSTTVRVLEPTPPSSAKPTATTKVRPPVEKIKVTGPPPQTQTRSKIPVPPPQAPTTSSVSVSKADLPLPDTIPEPKQEDPSPEEMPALPPADEMSDAEAAEREERQAADRRRSKRADDRERRHKRKRPWYRKLANLEVELPSNWKQLLVVGLIVVAAAVKIFAPTSDHVGVDAPPPPPVAPAPPPPPVAPTAAPVAAPPEASDEGTPSENPMTNDAEIEESRPPSHPATRLKVRVSQNADQPLLNLETDATPDQPIWLEVTGAAGMVLDRSHFYRRWAWRSGQPKSFTLTGLTAGTYHISATAGALTDEDHFELGTHTKGFSDRLRWSRKRLAYEFWSERKNLFLLTRQLSKHLGAPKKNLSAIDRIGRFDPGKYAFFDLWKELKEICKAAHKPEPNSAKGRLQVLQTKIAQLSVWR